MELVVTLPDLLRHQGCWEANFWRVQGPLGPSPPLQEAARPGNGSRFRVSVLQPTRPAAEDAASTPAALQCRVRHPRRYQSGEGEYGTRCRAWLSGAPREVTGGRSQARAPEVSRTGPSSLVSAGRKPQAKAAREASTTGRLALDREGAYGHIPVRSPKLSRTDRLDLGLTYAAVLTRSSVVGSQAALPSPCVSVQASVTSRTAVVATPASCVLCVRTPRRSGIPLPIRSATSTASPRVTSSSSVGDSSTLPTPAAERVAPARGAVSGEGRGSPLLAPATVPSGVRWPRRAAAAGASRRPSVGSVGTGLGLPSAFAPPPTGGTAMRVDSGRQAVSLAATDGVVTHGTSALPVDAPKAARCAVTDVHAPRFLCPAGGYVV
ncbi:uncharacterized protein LOC126184874 [Schistocerca cancellata]|uniref:uncharacterized protein LOC126184874 n=1 Tax=Schistocerca cancellata TaxID=274614 RepID=UPI0021199EE3|nr:uncharacterized protein LOC126184874 [Schistocerca cancellata]